MAISPITIATHGVLNSPLSVAAVRGRLRIITSLDGGYSPHPSRMKNPTYERWKSPGVIRDELEALVRREDEELIILVTSFIRVIDE